MKTRSRLGTLTPVVVAVTIAGAAGCGGENKAPDSGTAAAPPAAGATTVATTTPGPLTAPVPGSVPEGATAKMAALGDSIFHGETAGGMCFTCHGADAKGTALAPSLLAHKWITGDGSYMFIQQRVTEGVPTPTPPYPGPMLPMGGAQLTAAQIKAVAAYVYSISRG